MAMNSPAKRRLSRVGGFDDDGFQSPRRHSLFGPRKQKLSNEQLAELYSSCIKMSADNKINQKNVWSLSLIDYMGEQVEGNTDFTLASCTLDASVKIYATRVDSVHAELLRVLGGLTRGAASIDADDADNKENATPDGDVATTRVARTKTAVSGAATLEDNYDNIMLKKFDLSFTVDPLFQSTSAKFDEGGARGMLLNNLDVYNCCELIFDSSDANLHSHNTTTAPPPQLVDITALRAQLLSTVEDLNALELCPSVCVGGLSLSLGEQQQAPSDPLLASAASGGAEDHSARYMGDDDDDNDDDDNKFDQRDLAQLNLDAFTSAFGSHAHDNDDDLGGDGGGGGCDDGQDPYEGLQHAAATSEANTRATQELILALADSSESNGGVRDEYSFFDGSKLQEWAGPDFWRFRSAPKPRGENSGTSAAGADAGLTTTKTRARRQPKTQLLLDFTAPRAALAPPKKTSTVLSTRALNKGVVTTLPEDLHYDFKKFSQLFSKPNWSLRTRTDVSGRPLGAATFPGTETSGTNDLVLVCDDAMTHVGNTTTLTSFPNALSEYDDDDDDGFGLPEPEHEPAADAADDSAKPQISFGGMELISEPAKVNKIAISYATVAKRVNVRRLKHAIWTNLVSHPSEEPSRKAMPEHDDDDDDHPTGTSEPHKSERMPLPKTFNETVSSLDRFLPAKDLAHISVPFCFVCLLHLANEKGLEIADQSDLGDLTIRSADFVM
eukprot:gnl/Spiro4/22936_TR11319_c0_g1_i1.p1 gnl/Spiro4/22936_TR11319_c0_g1~~gnl/Spiro4/22936_TR11319_c0_g1_i1.p1  ORF type:complete len:746 (+),score=147.08 gnl/Spiro4/22936_TR11319_c0_g1_i1:66-2240(+)